MRGALPVAQLLEACEASLSLIEVARAGNDR